MCDPSPEVPMLTNGGMSNKRKQRKKVKLFPLIQIGWHIYFLKYPSTSHKVLNMSRKDPYTSFEMFHQKCLG